MHHAPRNAPKKSNPIDPIATLEQCFRYRVQEYLADNRRIDAEFTLLGLRGWMLCQSWPDPPASRSLECLAVLMWSAIRQVEADPDGERDIRRELERQIDFLDGSSAHHPATLNALLSPSGRAAAYANLRTASAPGSARRELWGLPRFNATDKLP